MAELALRNRFEWPLLARRFFDVDLATEPLRVEEYQDGNTLVVKAEMPGIDPDKDVDISVSDGILHIQAERQEQTEHKDKDSYRSEFHYGSFVRNIALPPGAKDTDVQATYKDGVLEVRLPVPERSETAAKIPITRG